MNGETSEIGPERKNREVENSVRCRQVRTNEGGSEQVRAKKKGIMKVRSRKVPSHQS